MFRPFHQVRHVQAKPPQPRGAYRHQKGRKGDFFSAQVAEAFLNEVAPGQIFHPFILPFFLIFSGFYGMDPWFFMLEGIGETAVRRP